MSALFVFACALLTKSISNRKQTVTNHLHFNYKFVITIDFIVIKCYHKVIKLQKTPNYRDECGSSRRDMQKGE